TENDNEKIEEYDDEKVEKCDDELNNGNENHNEKIEECDDEFTDNDNEKVENDYEKVEKCDYELKNSTDNDYEKTVNYDDKLINGIDNYNEMVQEIIHRTKEEEQDYSIVQSDGFPIKEQIIVDEVQTNEEINEPHVEFSQLEQELIKDDSIDKICETTSSHIINEASHVIDESGSAIEDIPDESSKCDSNIIPIKTNGSMSPEKTTIETPNKYFEKLENGHPVIDIKSFAESSVTANIFPSGVSTTTT
ncbi:2448_t:CDS:1, partial [Gigaspora rosea]